MIGKIKSGEGFQNIGTIEKKKRVPSERETLRRAPREVKTSYRKKNGNVVGDEKEVKFCTLMQVEII